MTKHNPKYIEAQKRGKVDYSTIPWEIIGQLAQAMMEGAGKYGRFNFLEDEIEARTYIAAIGRHLFGDPSTGSAGWVNGEDIDEESGLPHLIKVMACCMLVEAAKLHGKLIDNRMETESLTILEEASEVTPEVHDHLQDFIPKESAARVGKPHPPNMSEIIDMEKSPDCDAWDAVFTVLDEESRHESEQRRGPYETAEQAEDYARRNPENLPGLKHVQPSKVKVRHDA
tara:strand:- start:19544 stop:20227 length:684 start_codon:yes stop_codon:yes gene_type:complete